MITNLGTKQVSANTVFGNMEFFDAGGQPNAAMGVMAIAGHLLMLIGVVILIIGGMFLLRDRIRIMRIRKGRGNSNYEYHE